MVNDTVPTLSLVLNRSGNMSGYGNLKIEFISSKGKVTQVGEIKGIAVYTPTLHRKVKVILSKTPGINYSTGKLHLVYSTPPDSKSLKLAEGDLLLSDTK